MDEKGRLKIPAAFLGLIRENYSGQFFVTSTTGQFARTYPIEVWSDIEQRLAQISSTNRAKKKFLNLVSYYGQVVWLDKQGRVLIPSVLRESAAMKGEVQVVGSLTYLDIWNHQRFLEEIRKNPITPDDEKILDDLGV
ncbi:division/cell wall cluster transcriptional repressor MraZ [Acidobacteriia bacterium AH_259_A11_L15]|nr:division/cell wall cluster transcriptional repressor MraZ [Acidobacteriia bacterium AH_259_A11_L15]